MAEATGLRNNALPYPVYGAPYGVTFPIMDADGDLVTGASSLDSEVSKNGDTFADCTNEATEIATSSGVYYLLLTSTEMTADVVSVIVKTGTAGAKTTTLTLYPRKLVPLRSGTAAGGASGSITLDASAGGLDDKYNGCLCVATLDSAVEARIIDDYVGSTQVASVTPDWNTTPDSDDTFIIYLPEGMQIPTGDTTAFGGTAGTFSGGRPEVNTSHAAGTAWASGAITAAVIATGAIDADAIADNAIDAGAIADGAITAAKIATDAIDADALADGAITSGVFAAGAITAAAIADEAIDAATFAADVDAEILSYLVDDATRIDASALNTASGAIGSNGSGLTEAGGTGDQFTAIPWNAAWDAEVQSEVQDAIEANNLDHLAKIAVDTDFATTVHVDSVLGQMVQTADGGFSRATDSQEAIRDRGDAAWITATGFSTHSAADVWAAGTRTLTAGTNIALAKGTGVTGFNDLSAAEVNAEVVDVLRTDTLPDSYAADGSQPTIAQAVLMIAQFLMERSVSGTTLTVKKPDGSTTAMTFTLNDGTSPTAITRG